MKKSIAILLLFMAQIWVCFSGASVFGLYINAFLFFIVSLLIAYLYFDKVIGAPEINLDRGALSRYDIIVITAMCVAIIVCFIGYMKLFKQYNGTYLYSDVIPQMDALYDRLMRGEQPYYPVVPPAHAPMPAYMPLHWMPIGIARLLQVDLRYIGMAILCIAVLIYGYDQVRRADRPWAKVAIAVMPFIVLAYYYNHEDLPFVFETPVAAYYLILALGLARRDIWMTGIGIVLCLMSRYTMVFWLPLFAILLWLGAPRRQSLMVWAGVVVAVLLIYVIPFYMRAPNIIHDALLFHNNTVIHNWQVGGGPLDAGFYFAPHMRAIFSGEMAQRVYHARTLQACLMVSLVIAGIAVYYPIRRKVNFYDFSLGMLYLIVMCFYVFSPMIFRYYVFSMFFLTVVVCSRALAYTSPGMPQRA